MTNKELMQLTDDELHEISMQRKKNGCYTKQALEAQRILWTRADRPFSADKCRSGVCLDYYDKKDK